MRSLSGLSLRGLRRRPGRFALTGAGAALGVAVLYAVLVTSGATTAALDDAISGAAGEADVFIGPVGSYDATLPPALVDRVAAIDDVDAAVGAVTIRSSVSQTDEATIGDLSSREHIVFVVGQDLEVAGRLREFELESGTLPAPDADEIAVGQQIADDLDLRTGDHVTLATPAGAHEFILSGVLETVGAGAGFQGRVGYTSETAAQRMLGKGDVITGVDVVLADGVDNDTWIRAHREEIGQSVFIEDSKDAAAGFREFIAAISGGLTLMSAIAVFVGGFLVFLTFSVAVAERTRTYGTLRALGAHPKQVRRVVLGEAAILGLFASAIGLVLGRLIAGASVGVTETLLGLDLASLGMPVGPAIFAVVVGVAVSVGAAWLPGRRAAALSPVTAMREGAPAVERTGRLWPRVALLGAGIGVSLLGTGVATRSLATLLVLLAAVLLAPFVLRPVARVVGAVTSRIARGTGPIAVMHLVKERSRSAYTLALVMVVLAMLIAVAGAHTAMTDTLDRVIDEQAGSVQVIAPGAFDPDVAERLAEVDGADTVTPLRFGQTDRLTDDGSVRVDVTVIDPATYFEVAGFAWVHGDDDTATEALTKGGAVLLPDAAAVGSGIDKGDTVQLRTSEGLLDFTVAGTYAIVGQGFGAVAGAADAARFGAGRPNAFLIGAEDGVDPEVLGGTVDLALGDEYDLIIDTPEATRDYAFGQLRGFFSLAYVILIAAAAAGLLGLANTLAVSVLTRTHEIGILRSTGTLRRQIRRMVLVEAITLALVAFILALPLGLLLSLGTAGAFRGAIGATMKLTLPWAFLPPLLIATLVVATIASLIPARRAGRLEPVAALRFD